MIPFILNGLEVSAEESWTILEAARFYGLEIPTLCWNEGLTPYGGCRLCLVEIGSGPGSKLVSSCTRTVEKGLVVRTDTRRVVEARRMMIELMLSTAPYSKKIQDLASKFGVTQQRFKPRNEECVYLRPLHPDVRRADGRPGDRFPEPRLQAEDLDAFQHQVRGMPAVRRLHLHLPGLFAPLPGAERRDARLQCLPDDGPHLSGPLR